MFTNLSMTGSGIAIALVEYLLTVMNVKFEAGSVASFVNSIIVAVSFIFVVWGQMRRKDLSFGLFRN